MIITSKHTKGIIAVIVIAVVCGVISFVFWSSWYGFIAVLASLGGVIAFLGLWLEHEASEEEIKIFHSNFIGDNSRSKLKSKWGWWILMFGIGFEIATAGGFALYDAVENSRQDANNNPLKQPIAYLSATAWLKTAGIDRTATNNLLKMKVENPKKIDLAFGRRDRIKVPGFPTLFLSDGAAVPSGSNMWWHLQFNQLDSISPNQIELVKDAFKWDVVELEARFLPPKTEVITGYVTLTFNFKKRDFNIRSQTAKPQTEYNPFLDNPPTNVTVFGQ